MKLVVNFALSRTVENVAIIDHGQKHVGSVEPNASLRRRSDKRLRCVTRHDSKSAEKITYFQEINEGFILKGNRYNIHCDP